MSARIVPPTALAHLVIDDGDELHFKPVGTEPGCALEVTIEENDDYVNVTAGDAAVLIKFLAQHFNFDLTRI